jgi:arylsulfatase A-like enzyme
MNFIDNVDSIVGLENVLFVLTADHGGLPLPEYLTENGGNGGRINGDHLREALEWIDQESEELYGANLYHRSGSNFYLNNENIKKYDVNISDVYKLIEKYLLKVDGISEIISKQDILKNQKNNNKIISRIKNMIHPENSPDFFVILKRGYLYRSPHGTSHGTPYDYDTHVPLIFSKIDFKREINNSKRETVDIAPSIANLLGVDIPTYCDGKSIKL